VLAGAAPEEGKYCVSRILTQGSHLAIRLFAVSVLVLGLVAGLVAGALRKDEDRLTAIEPAGLALADERARQVDTAEGVAASKADAALVRRAAAERAAQLAAARKAAAVAKAKAEAARKAAAKAAAVRAAKREAERAAARRAAEARATRSSRSSSGSSGSSTPLPATPSSCTSYSGNQRTGCSLLSWAGFSIGQMGCLQSLWNRESGWRTTARNPSSGAYGIPQALPGRKMAAYGSDWETNPAVQIKWGLMYIKGRYGSPCSAWSYFQSNGWY